jgi:hypothetical protein
MLVGWGHILYMYCSVGGQGVTAEQNVVLLNVVSSAVWHCCKYSKDTGLLIEPCEWGMITNLVLEHGQNVIVREFEVLRSMIIL